MLPYLNYQNRIKLNNAVPHCLDFRNGFRVSTAPKQKIGEQALSVKAVAPYNDTTLYDPKLTYGCVQRPKVSPFRPDFVRNDNIVLTFNGFFRQTVIEPNHRSYERIRYVKVMYFMVDDTMTVIEPPVLNSGYPQGRIVRRSRVVKDAERNEFYSWKDLNVGIDLNIFGITYHLVDCDKFTREYLISNGIEFNAVETMHPPSTESQPTSSSANCSKPTSASTINQLYTARPKSNIVLTFNCVRIESHKSLSDCITYKLYYFLADDTIAIKELKENREGRDYFPLLLKRMKVPKNSKRILVSSLNFAEGDDVATAGDSLIFLDPLDLRIGEEIVIFGHRFLLLDCDFYTRKYYSDVLKMPQKEKVNIQTAKPAKPQQDVPEYLGFGTPEDSLASCLSLVPKMPRKNIVKYLLNANKYLRFGCVLDTVHPEDRNRKFILKLSLADGKISIVEPPIVNSGIQGGRFLSPQLIIKPGGSRHVPDYYTSKDLFIGAILTINDHRFKIVSADMHVYYYMQEHPELFSPEAINGVREYLLANNNVLAMRMDEEKLPSNVKGDYHHDSSTEEQQISDINVNLDNLQFDNRLGDDNPVHLDRNEHAESVCNTKNVRFGSVKVNDT